MTDHAKELADVLRWYIANDDTNETPDNAFYLNGLYRAQAVLAAYDSREREPS